MSITYKSESEEMSNWFIEIREEINVLTKKLEEVEKPIPFLEDKKELLVYTIENFKGTNLANTLSYLHQQLTECEAELAKLYSEKDRLNVELETLTDAEKHINKSRSELYLKLK